MPDTYKTRPTSRSRTLVDRPFPRAWPVALLDVDSMKDVTSLSGSPDAEAEALEIEALTNMYYSD